MDLEKFFFVKIIFCRCLGIIVVNGYSSIVVGVLLFGIGVMYCFVVVIEKIDLVSGVENVII